MSAADLRLADHLFRHEAGRIVSSLVRVLGVRHLTLAEDAVQDALVRALETWKFGRAPSNPAAWLTRAAHNRAVDLLRRQATFGRLAPELERALGLSEAELGGAGAEEAIPDDELRLMFSCCDPALAPAAQVAVILKYLCGFSVRELAQAFLSSEAAIEKQLFRSRRALEARGGLLEVGDPALVRTRLPSVQDAIYLLFSEGYHGAHPQQVIREDLCHEAMRLGVLLSRLPPAAGPETQALLALFCLLAARLSARMDDDGNLLLLAEQDRRRWDRELIGEGLRRLDRSAEGDALTAWHLEAAIAARHAQAASFAETDWASIRALYDLLARLRPTPVVALNRAIAVGMADGPEAGLRALAEIDGRERLARYPFFRAAFAELELRAGRPARAAEHLRAALGLARNPAEEAVLARKLAACGGDA
ncbi:RNA polymerase sigma factor [Anaeromyxobacter oryzae]|uniref:RNA polymerase subunit sigma-24 n=1 Tax=Anaeromyxobacter oryzae TaxID=2918170 RepID=A0ABN6MNW7_9BACT|nr:sigma-70 family RNA polymerase sigma factor [Anaeromyxobacter oryzae]BDG01364.1 RNA polymerase subunit sigma-24 [Anaeromyxobacter oryzae]